MKIYIDPEYKCHVSYSEGYREIETADFDGKCDEYIEGFMFVPEDSVWTRADGKQFSGAVLPWKPYTELYIAQLEHDIADADAALNELGVNIDG